MLRLAQLIAPFLLVAASAPVAVPTEPNGCIPFSPLANQLQLVRVVHLPEDESLTELVRLRQLGTRSFGEFLSKGGSLVVVDHADRSVGVINRETLDSVAISSDADVLKVSRDAVSEVSTQTPPSSAPAAPATTSRDSSWTFDAQSMGSVHPVDLRNLRPRPSNPGGMQIGDFDGVPAPSVQVVIGGNDGQLPPIPTGQPTTLAQQLPMSRALNATVAIYFRDKIEPGKIMTCNGVQIAAGLILTNLHCASKRYEQYVVHFGQLHIQPDTLLPGSPVSGTVRCRAVVASPYPETGTRLDFAVLRIEGTVPAPFDTAIAAIDDGSAFGAATATDIPAVQIQYWLTNASTSMSRQYEKYLMKPPQCEVMLDAGVNPGSSYFCNSDGLETSDNIDPAGIGHSCDSEKGSSGSPLFDANMGKVIALHRGGGELYSARNCAVPARQILTELEQWHLLQGQG